MKCFANLMLFSFTEITWLATIVVTTTTTLATTTIVAMGVVMTMDIIIDLAMGGWGGELGAGMGVLMGVGAKGMEIRMLDMDVVLGRDPEHTVAARATEQVTATDQALHLAMDQPLDLVMAVGQELGEVTPDQELGPGQRQVGQVTGRTPPGDRASVATQGTQG